MKIGTPPCPRATSGTAALQTQSRRTGHLRSTGKAVIEGAVQLEGQHVWVIRWLHMTVVDRNRTKSPQEFGLPNACRRHSSVLKDALQETHHFVCCRNDLQMQLCVPTCDRRAFLGDRHPMPGSYVCSYHPSSWAECLALGPDIGQRCRRCTFCRPSHGQDSRHGSVRGCQKQTNKASRKAGPKLA
jgi:hypothetical protein